MSHFGWRDNIHKEYGRFGFRFWTQWDFLWAKLNWYDFTFVQVEIEDDRMFGNLEFILGFLGFNLMVTWHYKDTGYTKRLLNDLDAFKETTDGDS